MFLGYFHFSVSWILLIVFIYLFRRRQRNLFKERHKMLREINENEEQCIKARLDELPSWVNETAEKYICICMRIHNVYRYFFLMSNELNG